MGGDRQDVAGALAQRGHLEVDDTDPVVEVRPEPPVRDHLGQVAVGRRDHPDIERDFFSRSHPLQLVLLQNPQQFGLH